MGLFEKKFDIVEDHLRIVFNPKEKSYDVYYGTTLIPDSKLSRKSKKYIENENNKLRINPDILADEMERVTTRQRFDKLKSLGYSCDSFEYLGPADGTMSKQMEDLLNRLVAENDVLLGIHRIGNDDSPEKIEDILKNGLQITGHFDGATQSNKELKNNVGYYPNNKTIIKELMYADKYKNSKGSILIRIPDADLEQTIFVVDSNGSTRLNPKYIVGYVPLCENHHLETIITMASITKTNCAYSYTFKEKTNDNQVYEQETEHKIRR